MRTTKQKIGRFMLFAFGFILLLPVGGYFYRDVLLKKAIAKTKNKFSQDYNCDFFIKNAQFEGLYGFSVAQITLVPRQADTLFDIKNLKTKIDFWQLTKGNVVLENLEIKNGFVQLVKNKNGKNYQVFLNSKTDTLSSKKDYAERAYDLITKALNLVPENCIVTNFVFKFDDMGKKTAFKTDTLTLKNKQFRTLLNVKTDTFNQNWNIKGMLNPREKIADLSIQNNNLSKIILPFVKEKFNLDTSFDNLHLKIDKIDMTLGELSIDGLASVDNLTLYNPRIANRNVVFNTGKLNFNFLIGSDFIALKDNSQIVVNSLKIKPYFEYNTQNGKVYTLKVKLARMKAQNFINSLPNGLFAHFQGMKADGFFDYNLNFKVNVNKPWQLVFDSKLSKYGLKITQYGQANLNKLNSDFTYQALINGVRQRPVLVGSGNPNFTPLTQISPYLQKCVLTCEDSDFMTHKGFMDKAFRQSITKNISQRRFVRGASTISMQLVKNVFLTREKTLSRKLEEILLVYILENNRIATKERMLEVYFNIIEWGPNVYGIGEAAQFYFQKKPLDLTLKECLFLAQIVPSPKNYMHLFDENGNLKTNATKHNNYVSKLMLRKGLLVDADTIGQKNTFTISGQARSFLKLAVKDTIAKDSLVVDEILK